MRRYLLMLLVLTGCASAAQKGKLQRAASCYEGEMIVQDEKGNPVGVGRYKKNVTYLVSCNNPVGSYKCEPSKDGFICSQK
jgi:hypothetical protein